MVFIIFFIFIVSGLVNVRGDCRLDPHPSVEYRCIVPDVEGGYRVCNTSEPVGTVVAPVCRTPNYYSSSTLPNMHCFDGENWDHIAKCLPDCGRVIPDGKELAIGGKKAKRGELPWHAGIYRKTTRPYEQICGGSLVSTLIVISAAHCFSDGKEQLPASKFAVAVGKIYRSLADKMDDGQQSDVKQIHIPERYRGSEGNFQEDIAVVLVAKEFQYKTHIRPVCLDFDQNFEKQQLFHGAIGKVAGWGLTAANGKASLTLQVLDMPYVDLGTCQKRSNNNFRELITADKICAGTQERDTALCKGDSGGGLVFEGKTLGVERYYLRGVVSTASQSEDACNTNTYIAFTSINRQEHFIKDFWNEQGIFKCKNGGSISVISYCDGAKDCLDGSDETKAFCSWKTCSSQLFRCAYGACVDKGSICNGIIDCADGSDEDEKMCSTKERDPAKEDDLGNCKPYLEHGTYTTHVKNSNVGVDADHNANIKTVTFNVTCNEGYDLVGESSIKCYNGYWPVRFPSCVSVCQLEPDESMEYRCVVYGDKIELRDCNPHEPIGTIVKAECRPDYYPTSAFSLMQCKGDGHWENKGVNKCSTTYVKPTWSHDYNNFELCLMDKIKVLLPPKFPKTVACDLVRRRLAGSYIPFH